MSALSSGGSPETCHPYTTCFWWCILVTVRRIKNEETVRFEAVYYTLNSYKEPKVYYTKNSDLQEIQVYPVNI